MLRRAQPELIKPLPCAAGGESIEGWRVKIETPQRRASNPPTRDGAASRGEVNNGRLSQRLIILLMEKPPGVTYGCGLNPELAGRF